MDHSKILTIITPNPRMKKTGQITVFHQKMGSQILTSLGHIVRLA